MTFAGGVRPKVCVLLLHDEYYPISAAFHRDFMRGKVSGKRKVR